MSFFLWVKERAYLTDMMGISSKDLEEREAAASRRVVEGIAGEEIRMSRSWMGGRRKKGKSASFPEHLRRVGFIPAGRCLESFSVPVQMKAEYLLDWVSLRIMAAIFSGRRSLHD